MKIERRGAARSLLILVAVTIPIWVPLLAQAQTMTPLPGYGIYLEKEGEWVRLDYQAARRVAVGEMGYVMGVMHRTRVFLLGARSEIRLSDPQPSIYFNGANPADFYTLVKLDNRNGLRQFHYSIHQAGGSAQVVEEYRVPVRIERVGKDLYRLTPAERLKPGEYGIVLGEHICPFGIDG
ncbi:MAG: hypothetical protein QHH30_05255 [candidate division NC10 bacterium]|nr:hypothetical protein [candidate division NC10 bacterium]